MEMRLCLGDQRTYQKRKNFIIIGNFNYNFDENTVQKDTDYPENSGKVLNHLAENGENNWRGMCYLITTTTKDLA